MKIGVCLASFNGELFIKEQITSILMQLSVDDILVVTDDNSSDSTATIVKDIGDSRIILIRNFERIGYVKNFERGLSYLINYKDTSVDIIFLSDQDDLWELNKVEKVVSVFSEDASVSFVYHKLCYVNRDLVPLLENPIQECNYDKLFLFRSIIRPFGFGCGMAFRIDVLRKSIPFPEFVYTHDHWIELMGYFSGRCVILDECLIKYRRQLSSLTEITKVRKYNDKLFSIFNILKTRFSYFALILIAWHRSRFRYPSI